MSQPSDVMDALLSIAATAGASVSPKYTDVKIGLAVPRGRCIRLGWIGETIPAPQLDGQRYTLASEMVGHRFALGVYENVTDMAEDAAAARMLVMADFFHAFRTAVDADRTLGGKVMACEPDAAVIDYVRIDTGLWAIGGQEIVAGMVEYGIGG